MDINAVRSVKPSCRLPAKRVGRAGLTGVDYQLEARKNKGRFLPAYSFEGTLFRSSSARSRCCWARALSWSARLCTQFAVGKNIGGAVHPLLSAFLDVR
jgi:hypothetical protein